MTKNQLKNLLDAATHTKLNVIYAMPSCVPATPFEDAGTVLEAHDMEEIFGDENIFGLGEFMNAPGIINCDDTALDKILLAEKFNKPIDGHAPNLTVKDLNAYMSAGVGGDHECTTVAESIGIYDRVAIKIGARADFVLLDDLKNFSVDRLKMNLTGGNVNIIGIEPGGVVTKKIVAQVKHDSAGDFIFDPARDICKVAVIERHHETGKIGLGLLSGYGIKRGAIAVSVAHDSHNIIAAGVSNDEIFSAVNALIKLEGGMVLVDGGEVIASIPLPIAGLMSTLSGEEFKSQLDDLHAKAHEVLGISNAVEPVMTLTFMSLPVIPELKLTARGLFDYATFDFIPLEA